MTQLPMRTRKRTPGTTTGTRLDGDQLLLTGYVVHCANCGRQQELPPFNDPQTVFTCNDCGAPIALPAALQAQAIEALLQTPAAPPPSTTPAATPAPPPIASITYPLTPFPSQEPETPEMSRQRRAYLLFIYVLLGLMTLGGFIFMRT